MFTVFGKLFHVGLFSLATVWGCAFQTGDSGSVVKVDTSENPYRLTHFGWQDAREWTISYEDATREFVHPVVVSFGLILLVAGVVVWSSEEDEICRLLGRRYVPAHCFSRTSKS
ncbi:MAG: hypothetical protein R3C03_07830 [Pirellulaceae bacterium]